MLAFNNTHIFTGYLKQILSTVNIPSCKIYTKDFAEYLQKHGKEDPRVVESFNSLNDKRTAIRVNYLKDTGIFNYFIESFDYANGTATPLTTWKLASDAYYAPSRFTPGLTRTLHSPGTVYDKETHEYLGEFLRFLRDYYNVDLMSLYNCFNNSICNNLYYKFTTGYKTIVTDDDSENERKEIKTEFNSTDKRYKIYAIPVKLFSSYTIALDCSQPIEMFCGFYKNIIETSDKALDFATKTYQRVNASFFKKPFLYDKLSVNWWNSSIELLKDSDTGKMPLSDASKISRYDIITKEQDLKLFIKVPMYCRSTITIIEGDYRNYNDHKYSVSLADGEPTWRYERNHTVLNFEKDIDQNNSKTKLISKLQLLELNNGESYPFASRLIEYLVGSAITPIDQTPDNIKRVQAVMNKNGYYFKIPGLWEDRMQKLLYDSVVNSGPIKLYDLEELKKSDLESIAKGTGHIFVSNIHNDTVIDNLPVPDKPVIKLSATNNHSKYLDLTYNKDSKRLLDTQQGYNATLGRSSVSTLYDVLGYVDKDTEKWYTAWGKPGKSSTIKQGVVRDSIQNANIYGNLYDIE